jgi:thiamine pyrophosphate-dependent acetolactate synthase large subunit-like protein
MSQQARLTVGEYLLARLKQLGVDYVFGVGFVEIVFYCSR